MAEGIIQCIRECIRNSISVRVLFWQCKLLGCYRSRWVNTHSVTLHMPSGLCITFCVYVINTE